MPTTSLSTAPKTLTLEVVQNRNGSGTVYVKNEFNPKHEIEKHSSGSARDVPASPKTKRKSKLTSDGYLGIPRSFPITSQPPTPSMSTQSGTQYNPSHNFVTANGASRSRHAPERQSSSESGLTVLPWEDFIFEPRTLNDMFHLERDGVITYDPEEVNVFFHATRMNKPTFGDIAENGKAWILSVDTQLELEQVRLWLTERISVFGTTLVKKEKRFTRSQRAPCLVVMDPLIGTVADKLHQLFVKCFSAMERKKNFCFEINLNGCVENWCTRVTGGTCKAVGARLVITNGEERDDLMSGENIFCCVACFPIWAIQTSILKVHRKVMYEDLTIGLDLEELKLHGSKGDIEEEKGRLFEVDRPGVFRTKPSEQGIAVLDPRRGTDFEGHKYIAVKKYNKKSQLPIEETLSEHETVSLSHLLTHIQKPPQSASSLSSSSKKKKLGKKASIEVNGEMMVMSSGYESGESRPTTKNSHVSSDSTSLVHAEVLVHASSEYSNGNRNSSKLSATPTLTRKSPKFDRKTSELIQQNLYTRNDYNEETDDMSNSVKDPNIFLTYSARSNLSQKPSLTSRSSESPKIDKRKTSAKFSDESDEYISDKSDESVQENRLDSFLVSSEKKKVKDFKLKRGSKKKSKKRLTSTTSSGTGNLGFEDSIEFETDKMSKSHSNQEENEYTKGSVSNGSFFKSAIDEDVHYLSQTFDSDDDKTSLNSSMKYKKMKQPSKEIDDSDISEYYNAKHVYNPEPKPSEPHYPDLLRDKKEQDEEVPTPVQKMFLMPDDDEFKGQTRNRIPQDKTDKACLIDPTDSDSGQGEPLKEDDLALTDCELDDDGLDFSDDNELEDKRNDLENTNENTEDTSIKRKRPSSRTRANRTSRYDSRRKYLGVHIPKRNARPGSTNSTGTMGTATDLISAHL